MSAGRFVIFTVVLLGLLGGLNAQVFRWARNQFGLERRGQRLLRAVLWAALAGTVLGRVAGRLWPNTLTTSIIALGSTLELAAVISGVVLLLFDALLLVWRLPARFLRTSVSSAAPATAPAPVAGAAAESLPQQAASRAELPRRTFLGQAAAGSAFLIGSSSSLYGVLKGRLDYSIEEVPIKLPGLARAFDGFTIAQLSDLHIGAFVGDAELATAEELLRKAKPDLIVLTGDLLDNDPRLAGELARFVRRLLPLAREGVIAIPGNHDYFAGVEDVAASVRAGGAHFLRNQSRVIGDAEAGFALLGVDDVWAERHGSGPDLSRALRTLPELAGKLGKARGLPRILLCHNPSYFKVAAGQVGLQISGHTHGGQVNLGLRPAQYLLPGGWVAGRYEQRGSTLYVNRGFGTVGPPARIGAPPEVTRFVLTT